MGVSLDGQILFDEQHTDIEQGSFTRASIERTVPGLEGMLSIDLGSRSRKIKQTGGLRAASRAQLNEKIDAITSNFMDGDIHTLTVGGEEFGNLRMDSFKVSDIRASGGGAAADYEIVYTQLTP